MDKVLVLFGALAVAATYLLVVGAIASLPVMLLWNYAAVSVLGVKSVTWFQAWCLAVLCGLLFKSSTGVKGSEK